MAEMVTEVDAATALVATVKVALVAPAGTVTLAGTVATVVLLLERLTTAPPAGAAPLSVTVPWEEFPPATLVGFSVSEERMRQDGNLNDAIRVDQLNVPFVWRYSLAYQKVQSSVGSTAIEE